MRLELIRSGEASEGPLVVSKRPTRRRGGSTEGAFQGTIIPRKVCRNSNQRRESRHHGPVGIVTVRWSQCDVEAQVINVSECGLMLEAQITPGIGDRIEICFEGGDSMIGAVIWRKGFRIGLDFGQPVIDLIPLD